jgi:hypothetical protein
MAVLASDVSISVLSSEYVQVPVMAQVGGEPYNPTGDEVFFSFVPGYYGNPSQWVTGSWSTTVQGTYLAQCLIGAAGTGLQPGVYTIWLRVTDNPEVPVKQAGTLSVY